MDWIKFWNEYQKKLGLKVSITHKKKVKKLYDEKDIIHPEIICNPGKRTVVKVDTIFIDTKKFKYVIKFKHAKKLESRELYKTINEAKAAAYSLIDKKDWWPNEEFSDIRVCQNCFEEKEIFGGLLFGKFETEKILCWPCTIRKGPSINQIPLFEWEKKASLEQWLLFNERSRNFLSKILNDKFLKTYTENLKSLGKIRPEYIQGNIGFDTQESIYQVDTEKE